MKLKFRYKDTDGLHYLTPLKYNGDLVMIDSKGKKYFVDEDELDFFVGYDSDEKEIYEGDILTDERIEREFKVELKGGISVKTWDIGDKVYYWHLKERGENEASDF